MADAVVDDGYMVDVPDIPMPDETAREAEQVEDQFDAGFRFAFIGSGQGGCIAGSTNIYVSGRGIVPIADFYREAMEAANLTDLIVAGNGDVGVRLPRGAAYTIAVDCETGKCVRAAVQAVWKNKASKPRRLALAQGAFVDCSWTHPMMVCEPMTRRSIFGRSLASVKPLGPGARIVDTRNRPVELGEEMSVRGVRITPDIAWLLGVFAGDGSVRPEDQPNEVSFYIDSPEVAKKLEYLGPEVGATSVSITPRPGCVQVSFFGVQASLFIRSAFAYDGGRKDATISVPRCVSAARLEQRVAFAAGVVDSDCGVEDRWCELELSTVSRRFADEFSCLIATIGGRASVEDREPKGKEKRESWRVSVAGKFNFGPTMPLLVSYVQHRERHARLEKWLKARQGSFATSSVPLCYDEVRPWLTKAGFKTPYRLTDSGGPNVKHWYAGTRRLSAPAFASMTETLEQTEPVQFLHEVGASLREISSVDEVEVDGYYDLSVEDHENYLAGNRGLVFTHNSRMAEAFWKLGYRRVCCVNTNAQDMAGLEIPEANRLVMDIGSGGAGKNPDKGKEAATRYYEDIYDLMRRSFGRTFDRILVCVGAGGGTGGGSCQTIIEIAHDIAKAFKAEESGGAPAVGVMVSLPRITEGAKVNLNAHGLVTSLFGMVGSGKGKLGGRSISPLIVVDNDRVNGLYPNLPVATFWDTANRSVSALFHLFNSISVRDSEFATFDKADLKDLLESGAISFGACPLRQYAASTDVSHAIRDNLRKNVLVGGFDLHQAKTAGCVFIGSTDVLAKIPQEYLEHGFDMLSRIMGGGSVVHRGIYRGNKPGLVVYSILGELGVPQERMDEIARTAGIGK